MGNGQALAAAAKRDALSVIEAPDEPQAPAGLGQRIATIDNDLRFWLDSVWSVLSNDRLAQPEMLAKAGHWWNYTFGLYQERKAKDGHLSGILSQRAGAVASAPRNWLPADDSDEAANAAAFVQAALAQCRRFEAVFRLLVEDGAYLNEAWAEVIWAWRPLSLPGTKLKRVRGNGSRQDPEVLEITPRGPGMVLLPVNLIPVHPCRFAFSSERDEMGEHIPRLLTVNEPEKGIALPPRKFLLHSPDAGYGLPREMPLAGRVWWWSFFKGEDMRSWLAFNEKFSSPTVWMKYPKSAQSDEVRAHKRTVTSVRNLAGIATPDDVELALLEAARSGSLDCFKTLAEFCNFEMSKAVLGATLTAEAGDRGARALGDVHKDVRGDIVRSDGLGMAETMTTLGRWICELNGIGPAPRLEIDTDPPADAKANLERFVIAKRDLRMELDEEQVRREGNLAKPEPGSSVIAPDAEPVQIDPNNPDTQPPSGGKKETPKGGGKAAAAGGQARLTAQFVHEQDLAAEAVLPAPSLTSYRRKGVSACAQLLDPLPGLAVKAFGEYLAARYGDGINPVEMGQPLSIADQGWASSEEHRFSFPGEMKAGLIEQTNNDLSCAALLGRAKIGAQDEGPREAAGARHARHAPLHAASVTLAAAEGSGRENPEVRLLFDEERIIPRQVTALLARKGLEGLTSDEFYQLDALARAASGTAWDTAELTVQQIIGAVEDAASRGWTRQQFADYLWDNLQARYVKQGTELHAWHVETIYDTNLATAYNHAQMDELWERREIFPFVQFINPDPQFETCRAMAGKVWRVEDPAVRQYTPPLHFNCGSSIASLTSAEGYELQQGPPSDPDTGRPLLPEIYRGPADPVTGQRRGVNAPFGAWAPFEERYAHLRAQKEALGL